MTYHLVLATMQFKLSSASTLNVDLVLRQLLTQMLKMHDTQ